MGVTRYQVVGFSCQQRSEYRKVCSITRSFAIELLRFDQFSLNRKAVHKVREVLRLPREAVIEPREHARELFDDVLR